MKNEPKDDFTWENGNLLYRVGQIFSGIGKPRGSIQYKVAVLELQRLGAPVAAIVLPMVLVLVMIVFAGMQSNTKPVVITVVPEKEAEVTRLEDPPPPEDLPKFDDIEEITVKFDNPVPNTVASPTPTPTKQDMVREVPGTLVMKGIVGGREGAVVGGGGLGAGARQEGDLLGTLYDFKRDAKGAPRKVDYWQDLKTVIDGKFSAKAFSGFYKVDRNVYLSHLWVPASPAEIGPKAFGVEGLMEPKGWVAHYTGAVQPEEGGQYRFVGHFDDAMVVMIDGKVVLEAEWDFAGKAGIMGWAPKEFNQKHPSPTGQSLVYGDWVELSPTQAKRIDLVVGERPGGKIGGILLIQKKGVEYPKASDGRPLLPPFLTSPLSFPERARLEKPEYNGFKVFNMDIPLMNTAGRKKADLRSAGAEVGVDSGDL